MTRKKPSKNRKPSRRTPPVSEIVTGIIEIGGVETPLAGTARTMNLIGDLVERVERHENEISHYKQLVRQQASGNSESREPWQPFEVADEVRSPIDDKLADKLLAAEKYTMFVNNHYHVARHDDGTPADGSPHLIHLSIRRNDRLAINDWRDMQRIKNEIVGPEAEAVQLHPAEHRLVDGANQYHLWCTNEGEMFPFGFKERLVSESTAGGVSQRKWHDDERPDDLQDVTEADMKAALDKALGED